MKLLDKDGLTYYTGKIKNELTDYVKNTDYATSSIGGVIKAGHNIGVNATTGVLSSTGANLSSFNDLDNYALIGKGQVVAYVGSVVGDIQTLLDNLNTGSGV